MNSKNLTSGNVRIIVVDDSEFDDGFIEIKICKSILNNITSTGISFNNNYNDTSITKREVEVLKQLAKGLNNNEISNELNISLHTTKAHIRNIFSKLSVSDRTEAVVVAIKDKIINILQL